MASMLVLILKYDTHDASGNIARLIAQFSNPYFHTEIYDTTLPTKVPDGNNLSLYNYQLNELFKSALNYAAVEYPDLPCLLIRDSSITLVEDADIIQSEVATIFNSAQADLYFLNKMMDRCDKFKQVDGAPLTIKWTIQPTAIQSIIFVPSSRDYIAKSLITTNTSLSDMLNFFISQQVLTAITITPNLISFDVNVSTNNSDYKRMNECMPVSSTSGTPGVVSILWLFIILFAIFVVGWSLIHIEKVDR